jgi:sialate O-acetylesterase
MPNEVANRLGTDSFDESQGIYTTVGVNAGAGRYMYNHYMAPFERYPLAGVIWYQGESDCLPEHAVNYPEKFAALMTYMRGTHNLVNPDFPVYYVEFPSIYTQPAGFTPSANAPMWAYMETGIIRASMGRIPRVLTNSYPIVSSDLWDDRTFWNNLHPYCKYDQAERIAETVLAVLGEKGTLNECAGPKVVDYVFSEDGKSVVLTYDYVGEGLTTSDGGTAVRGFWAVGEYLMPDGTQILSAEITAKNQVTVTCDGVITALVYHNVGTNYFGDEINLCSSYGVPAGATAVLSQK